MSVAVNQAANVAPPRRGAVIALEVDATVRAYEIQKMNLGGYTPNDANIRQEFVFLTLQAVTGDVYYYFSKTNDADLDPTADVTVGTTPLVFANTYGARLVAGSDISLRIDRSQDKFLVIRTASSTATLRFWASSEGF